MITLNTFAKTIENGLNKNTYGLNYSIFTDGGTFKKAFLTRTEKTLYTNGLLRLGESTVIPTQGLVVATQDVSLEIVVQLFNPQTDEEVIATHRAVLDAYFEAYTVIPITENGKTYTVSAVYSLANTGDVQFRDGIGTSITFIINIEYGYIENGLNSADCEFTLNGMLIPYSSAKITESPTPITDAYAAENGVGQSVNVSFVHSFDFQLPALSEQNSSTAFILSAMFSKNVSNTFQLGVKLGDMIDEVYTVIRGETDLSLDGINNAGMSVSFTEALG